MLPWVGCPSDFKLAFSTMFMPENHPSQILWGTVFWTEKFHFLNWRIKEGRKWFWKIRTKTNLPKQAINLRLPEGGVFTSSVEAQETTAILCLPSSHFRPLFLPPGKWSCLRCLNPRVLLTLALELPTCLYQLRKFAITWGIWKHEFHLSVTIGTWFIGS